MISGCERGEGSGEAEKSDNGIQLSVDEERPVPAPFSHEKEELYSRRYEEGYNLYDPDYYQWLTINHPDAATALPEISILDSFVDVEPLEPVTLTPPPNSPTPHSQPVVATPLPTSSCSPITAVKSTQQTTPLSATSPGETSSSASTPSSSIREYLSPLTLYQSNKPKKTGTARVLTSAECLKSLEEKKRQKEFLIEERERKKQEREKKKKEREELARKRKEEREQRIKIVVVRKGLPGEGGKTRGLHSKLRRLLNKSLPQQEFQHQLVK